MFFFLCVHFIYCVQNTWTVLRHDDNQKLKRNSCLASRLMWNRAGLYCPAWCVPRRLHLGLNRVSGCPQSLIKHSWSVCCLTRFSDFGWSRRHDDLGSHGAPGYGRRWQGLGDILLKNIWLIFLFLFFFIIGWLERETGRVGQKMKRRNRR